MKILYIGDVYGERGLEACERFLPQIKREYPYHMLIVNGENSADGLGMRLKEYKRFMALGAHVITLGNHSFSKNEIFDFIEDANIVRPLNYPPGTPGKGYKILQFNQQSLAVVQVMGRVHMHDPLDNPFTALDQVLETIQADYILVDVHAEATSEKLVLGHYLDGRVNAVLGTHTHVQTNDAMRLPQGTLYLTDVGMTGVKFGIIGADRATVMKKFTTGLPLRLFPSEDTTLQLNAAYLDLDLNTIQTLHYSDDTKEV
jgi:metallophosphoesterase (TIGR00282 family)